MKISGLNYSLYFNPHEKNSIAFIHDPIFCPNRKFTEHIDELAPRHSEHDDVRQIERFHRNQRAKCPEYYHRNRCRFKRELQEVPFPKRIEYGVLHCDQSGYYNHP